MSIFHFREPFSAWSHGIGFLLALLGTLWLWHRSRGTRPAMRLSLMVFGLSLAFCYLASTLYHGLRISGDRLSFFDRMDRIGIFFLISGTYTPLAWGLLRGRWRWGTLTVVWLITAVASTILAIGGPFPPLLNTGLYLGMGWGCIACYAEAARVVSHRALRPLVAGGVFYSVGAVLERAPLAGSLAGPLRGPRPVPPLRAGRQRRPLLAHSQRCRPLPVSVSTGHARAQPDMVLRGRDREVHRRLNLPGTTVTRPPWTPRPSLPASARGCGCSASAPGMAPSPS